MDKNVISPVNEYIYFPVMKVNTLKNNCMRCAINFKFRVVGGMTESTWSWDYLFESMVLHHGVEVTWLRAEGKEP